MPFFIWRTKTIKQANLYVMNAETTSKFSNRLHSLGSSYKHSLFVCQVENAEIMGTHVDYQSKVWTCM